jgi:hypothetical protein
VPYLSSWSRVSESKINTPISDPFLDFELCAFFESEDDEIGDDFKSNDFFEILESESGSTEVSESDPFWDSNDLFKSESDFKANDFFEVLESEFDEDSDPLKD